MWLHVRRVFHVPTKTWPVSASDSYYKCYWLKFTEWGWAESCILPWIVVKGCGLKIGGPGRGYVLLLGARPVWWARALAEQEVSSYNSM